MKTNPVVAKDNFDNLLNWLSEDRDHAGTRFENIRGGLTRFFRLKGCQDPESLADESMNRVIDRFDKLDQKISSSPTTIFWAFANNVYLEYVRSQKKLTSSSNGTFPRISLGIEELSENPSIDCLRDCMNTLKKSDRSLIIEYYSEDNKEKMEFRRQIATQNMMEMGALHTKIYRIKLSLRPCLERCLGKKNIKIL